MKEPLSDKSTKITSPVLDGTPPGQPGNGLLHVASASEVVAAQKDSEEKIANAALVDQTPHLVSLEKYLRNIFNDARDFKETETNIQSTMIDSLMRKNGEYPSQKLNDLKSVNSSEAFLGLTGVKCRAFEAFVHDIYMNAKRKRTWSLKPTPVVTLPEADRERIKAEVMAAAQDQEEPISPAQAYELASDKRAEVITREYKEALKKSENMSRVVHDQLVEGGWVKAMSDGILDLSTMKAMIIKGPIMREKKIRTGWRDGKVVFEMKKTTTFERVSPLDLYPSRYADGVDGTPLCEKVTMSRSSLVKNRDKDGYHKENIEHVALHGANHSMQISTANERENAEDRDNVDATPVVNDAVLGSVLNGIEYWVSCRGKDLIEFGITKDGEDKPIDTFLDYEINAITIGDKIVFTEFNTDPLGRRPYAVTGFAKEIGGFWYRSVPELLKDPQDIVNAGCRALVNNTSWASGPQVIIPNVNNLHPDEDIENFHALKIWQGVGGANAGGQKLVDFYQPDSRSAELLNLINEFLRIADNLIEMPSYTHGSDKVAGAGRTSSGLSMLMSSSSRGMKRIILDLDRNIFQSVIEMLVDYNLETSDDDSIKGDMNFYSEGVIALIMREQLSERRMTLLQATDNEFDRKILGMNGRAKILAGAIEALESDYDDIMPTEEKIDELIKQEEILQKQQIEENEIKMREAESLIQREAEIEMGKAQLEMEKLDVERRKQDLEFKSKERELDIRATKQAQDTLNEMTEEPAPAAPAKPDPTKEPANA